MRPGGDRPPLQAGLVIDGQVILGDHLLVFDAAQARAARELGIQVQASVDGCVDEVLLPALLRRLAETV